MYNMLCQIVDVVITSQKEGGAVEVQCCQGNDSKHQAQSHSNGHKCPDSAWAKFTAATKRSSVGLVSELVLLLTGRL